MSTSTARVGYLAKRAIDWRIWDPTGGALINDVSLNDAENEVLFVPGQKLQIEKINFVWRHYPQAGNEKIKGPAREGVSAPSDRFPQKRSQAPGMERPRGESVGGRPQVGHRSKA